MVSEVLANSHHFVEITMACNVFKSVISPLGKVRKKTTVMFPVLTADSGHISTRITGIIDKTTSQALTFNKRKAARQ